MMLKPTPKAINAVRKKYRIPKGGSITSAQYREACGLSASSGRKADTTQFSFTYKILYFSFGSATIEIKGSHLSKNRVDSLPFKAKLRYKKAFKDGARALYLLEKKRLRSLPVMQRAKIHFFVYSPIQRDYDNNSETVKRVQDTLVAQLGLIPDDNPDVLISNGKPQWRKCKRGEERIIVVLRRIGLLL